VVAEGRLNASRELIATQILAKHDENYMPPEVAAALEGKSSAPADSLLP
jgi:cytochrome c-type biogenesis protein CcmE